MPTRISNFSLYKPRRSALFGAAAGVLVALVSVLLDIQTVRDTQQRGFQLAVDVVSKHVVASLNNVDAALHAFAAETRTFDTDDAGAAVLYGYSQLVLDEDRPAFEARQTVQLNAQFGTNRTYAIKDMQNRVSALRSSYDPVTFVTSSDNAEILLVDLSVVGNRTTAIYTENTLVIAKSTKVSTLAAFVDMQAFLEQATHELNTAAGQVGVDIVDISARQPVLLAQVLPPDGETAFTSRHVFQFKDRHYELRYTVTGTAQCSFAVYLFSVLLGLSFVVAGTTVYPSLMHRRSLEIRRERSNVVHDYNNIIVYMVSSLRAPLAALAFTSGVLVERARGSDLAHQEQLAVLHAEVAKMGDIVANYTDITSLDVADRFLKERATDLNAVVASVVQQYSVLCPAGVELVHDDPDAKLVVLADPDRFRQIVSASLRKSMSHTEAGAIIARTYREGSEAVFEIRDCGPTLLQIAQADFSAFAHNDLAAFFKQDPGLLGGMGMVIARELAARMRGRIVYANRADAPGLLFRFFLPADNGRRR